MQKLGNNKHDIFLKDVGPVTKAELAIPGQIVAGISQELFYGFFKPTKRSIRHQCGGRGIPPHKTPFHPLRI